MHETMKHVHITSVHHETAFNCVLESTKQLHLERENYMSFQCETFTRNKPNNTISAILRLESRIIDHMQSVISNEQWIESHSIFYYSIVKHPILRATFILLGLSVVQASQLVLARDAELFLKRNDISSFLKQQNMNTEEINGEYIRGTVHMQETTVFLQPDFQLRRCVLLLLHHESSVWVQRITSKCYL